MKGRENIEPHKFKKGQSGNPKGRPPKLVSHLNAELLKDGYRPVTPGEVTDAMLTILNLPMERLRHLARPDGDEPFLYKLMAKELLGKRGEEALERLLDRAHGKPKQQLDHTSNGGPLAITITREVITKPIERTK